MEAIAKGWPLGNRENITVGNPESNTSIAALWTLRGEVTNLLTPDQYAIVGQQYSNDPSALLRNLAANTNIRHLVICGTELSGSGVALQRLWENGVDQKGNIVGVEKASIESEIPQGVVDAIRNNVDLKTFFMGRKKQELDALKKDLPGFLDSLPKMPAWGEAMLFPKTAVEIATTRPSEAGAHYIRAKTMGKVWLRILQDMFIFGEVDGSFAGERALGLSNVITVIENKEPSEVEEYYPFTKETAGNYVKEFTDPERPTGVYYTYGERIWGYEDREQTLLSATNEYLKNEHGIALPNPFIFTPPLGVGQRIYQAEESPIINQVDQVILDRLKKHHYDNAAVAVLYDPVRDTRFHSDIPEKGFNMPCVSFLQASVRAGKMEMTAVWRSNEMYLAWPQNVWGLLAIQKYIADGLELPVGPMITHSVRTQFYENRWKDAQKTLQNFGHMAYGFEDDPRGNFLVRADSENGNVGITHMPPVEVGTRPLAPEFLAKASGRRDVTRLVNQMIREGRLSSLENAADLAASAAYATIAIEAGLPFVQDKDEEFRAQIREMAEKARKFDQLQSKNY
jgi:thymidylate synthase